MNGKNISSPLYSCESCNEDFKTNYGLKKHQMIHTGERPQKCLVCPFDTRDPAVLTRHIRTVHTGVKSFICEACNFAFSLLSQRNVHFKRVQLQQKIF